MPITNTVAGQARLAAVTLLKAMQAIAERSADLNHKAKLVRDRAASDIYRWSTAALKHVGEQPTDADPLAALREALESTKLAYVREDGPEQSAKHFAAAKAAERAVDAISKANADAGPFVAQG